MQANIQTEEDKIIEGILSKFKHKFAVLSGKGGTGKTTITVNIAQTLANLGYKVGVLDSDITGPNIPLMFGVEHATLQSKDIKILPIEVGNIKIVSIEFLLEDKSKAIIWRGPMKIKALKQLIKDVEWGELDFFIVDLPPGSSDEPLSIVQTIKDLDGMVIVTTPQEDSLLDVKKSIKFAEVTNVPIIGVIENMSGFKCQHCNEITYIFKKDGGKNVAKDLSLDFLGVIPIIPEICEAGDIGEPAVNTSDVTKNVLLEIVNKIINKTANKA